jgi:hypothetical protein
VMVVVWWCVDVTCRLALLFACKLKEVRLNLVYGFAYSRVFM